jgi:hypothetical protein
MAISAASCLILSTRRSRHWAANTPISIFTIFNMFGDVVELQSAQQASCFVRGKAVHRTDNSRGRSLSSRIAPSFRLEDRPKAEFFAWSPAGFFVEWEQTSRDRARRPGISNRPAGLESWSNRGPNLPSGCEPSRRARRGVLVRLMCNCACLFAGMGPACPNIETGGAVDKFVARLSIEHYRKKLTTDLSFPGISVSLTRAAVLRARRGY